MKRFLLVGASFVLAVLVCQRPAALAYSPSPIATTLLDLMQKKPAAKKPSAPVRPTVPKRPAEKSRDAEKSRGADKRGGADKSGRAEKSDGADKRGSAAAAERESAPSERKATKKAVAPLALQWPVSGRKIVEAYGERLNPTTKTVTLNPGVNIASKKGAEVRAAAAGKVSLVSWLPGFGTFVIVEHRDGYRTVYARLARASVATGAAVRAGARIGTAAGATVHFEVWRGQARLDPADLLP